MVSGAAKAIQEAGSSSQLLAVTVLTSLNQDDLVQMGVVRPVAEQVVSLGKLAVEAGANGLVCSPLEVSLLRQALGAGPVLVTPGVRPAGAGVGDQKRVMTPGDAIRAGSTYLVIGRPVVGASNRREAAVRINEEIEQALAETGVAQ